jgi:CheY-like chemotaxis protein
MENEEELCDVVEGMLLHFGYDVVFAKDGIEAIVAYQYAKDTCAPFDAIIMDLTIPGGMGGKEAIERLRELDPDVKAIVASGYANDPIMADYRAYGFVGRIAKPYRTDTLYQTLRDVIG